MKPSLILKPLAAALSLALACAHACAEKKPLDDDELRRVEGHGITLAIDLKLNTSVAAGFTNNGTTTYAVVDGFGGGLQLFAITIDAVARPDGGSDYLSIGMPGYLHAKDFGIHGLAVQTDPNAAIAGGLGSLTLNGTAAMTGQLNLWAK